VKSSSNGTNASSETGSPVPMGASGQRRELMGVRKKTTVKNKKKTGLNGRCDPAPGDLDDRPSASDRRWEWLKRKKKKGLAALGREGPTLAPCRAPHVSRGIQAGCGPERGTAAPHPAKKAGGFVFHSVSFDL
jgi:hypothetical protein